MFEYKFNNGTGLRCWVAGWSNAGKNGEVTLVQQKVDVPIYDRRDCEIKMRENLSKKFRLVFNFISKHTGGMQWVWGRRIGECISNSEKYLPHTHWPLLSI